MSAPFAEASILITVDNAALQASLQQAQQMVQNAFNNMNQGAGSAGGGGGGITGGITAAFQSMFGVISSGISALSTMLAGGLAVGMVGMTGGILYATDAAGKFEQAMTNAQSVLQATAPDFERLRDLALQLGRDTKFTSTEAAEGLKTLALAGLSTTQIMSALPAVLDLAAVANIKVESAARTAANAIKAFGMEAENLGHVNDVLTVAFTSANTNVEQLSVALRYAAPAAKLTGTSIEDLTAILARMADAGFNASIAGTAVRNAMSRLEAPTKAAKQLMTDLGIEFESFGKEGGASFLDILGQVEEKVKSGQLDLGGATTIFGARGASQLLGSLEAIDKAGRSGVESMRALSQTMKDIPQGFAHDMAQKQLDTFQGQMKILESSIDNLFISLGTGIIEQTRPAIDYLIKAINYIAESQMLKQAGGMLGEIINNVIFLGAKLVDISETNPLAKIFMDALAIIRDMTADWDSMWELLKTGASVVFEEIKLMAANMVQFIVDQLANLPGLVAAAVAGTAANLAFNAQANPLIERRKQLMEEISGERSVIRIGGRSAEEELADVNEKLKVLNDQETARRSEARANSGIGIAERSRDQAVADFQAKQKEIEAKAPQRAKDRQEDAQAIVNAGHMREQLEIAEGWDQLNFGVRGMSLAEREAKSASLKGRQFALDRATGVNDAFVGPMKGQGDLSDQEKGIAGIMGAREKQKQNDMPLADLFDAARKLAQDVDKIDDANFENQPNPPANRKPREGDAFDAALRVAGGNKAQAAMNMGLGPGDAGIPVTFGFSGLEALSKSIQEGLSEKPDDKQLTAIEAGNTDRKSIEAETKLIRKSLEKFDKVFGLFGM